MLARVSAQANLDVGALLAVVRGIAPQSKYGTLHTRRVRVIASSRPRYAKDKSAADISGSIINVGLQHRNVSTHVVARVVPHFNFCC